MFYYLFEYLDKFDLPGAGVFQYISFRSAMAVLASLIISLLYGKKIIKYLRKKQIGESIRELGLEGQINKKGTPTMGGLIIIMSLLVSSLLWCDFTTPFIYMPVAALIWFGMIGWIDDRSKIRLKSSNVGLSRSKKLVLQGIFGLFLSIIIFSGGTTPYPENIATFLYIPFFKNF